MSQQAFLTIARFLARLDPRLWEIPFPHNPLVGYSAASLTNSDAVSLNPQPLPPGELLALAVADAHLSEIVRLANFGDGAGRETALRRIADVDELCPPLWPKPPKGVFPPRWWWDFREPMRESEAFFMGARFLSAAEVVGDDVVREALTRTGLRMMEAGVKSAASELPMAAE